MSAIASFFLARRMTTSQEATWESGISNNAMERLETFALEESPLKETQYQPNTAHPEVFQTPGPQML